MKLFIIGNGFDKGHELKTGYWDFRTFLFNCYPDFLYDFESHYNLYPGSSDTEKQDILWNEFEANLANIDEDIIIEDASSIDMGLEGGDIDIEDTLYPYISEEYNYIEMLPIYLKRWIRSIRIRDVKKKTSFINTENDDMYINFNYTSVLESVYKISEDKIIHIHGSLRERYGEPIIGHGNKKRIHNIRTKIERAEEAYEEKELCACKVIENYYIETYKNVNRYMNRLSELSNKKIQEIIVIGHSIAGVDMPYFTRINEYTDRKAKWNVYYFNKDEKNKMYNNLVKCGVQEKQINMKESKEFYDLI